MRSFTEYVQQETSVSGTMITYFSDPELLAQIVADQEAMQEYLRELAKIVRPPLTDTAIARFI
jgi:hypothetical protein